MDNTLHAIFGITCQPGAIFLTLLRLLFYSKNPILDAELATPCGHSFCGFCVDIFKKTNQGQSSTCEMCRQPVTAFCSNRLGLRKSSAQTRLVIKPKVLLRKLIAKVLV